MNLKKLKETALALQKTLEKYEKIDSDAKKLSESLNPIIDSAIHEKILSPIERREIPGSYFFNEKNLQQYKDLSRAYAHFSIEATGGESPALFELKKRMGEI